MEPVQFRAWFKGDRYEVRNATMVDLVRTAYGVDAERVAGGPAWVDFDRFDISGLARPNTPPETLRLMLQSLLADRFKLALHNDSRPVPALALSLSKGKPKLQEAKPAGKTGCERQPVAPGAAVPGQLRIPLNVISCRNMTMEAFAAELKGIAGAGYVGHMVVDSTGLKGAWDFDFKFTEKALLQISGPDGISLTDALDKQLGLKLDEQKMPAPVIVVDRVNEKPNANPADVARRLPPLPPAEFEVAVIKPLDNSARAPLGDGFGLQPGGRLTIPGGIIPLKQLIRIAWDVDPNEEVSGAPKWLDSARYNIIAKLPTASLEANPTPSQTDVASMLQPLLTDRFKMKTHFEDRMVTAYTLTAAKPKLKKADPATRTGCKLEDGRVIANGGTFIPPPRVMTCLNITMAQFADQLQSAAGVYVRYPVVDATGLDGGWDLSFSFSLIPPANPAGATPFVSAGGPELSDPTGTTSLFSAIEKQLGLKLEAQKRSYPALVIDHIEEKPNAN